MSNLGIYSDLHNVQTWQTQVLLNVCQLLLSAVSARRFEYGQAAGIVSEGKNKCWIGNPIVIVNQLVSSLRSRIDAHREVREVLKDVNEINADQIRFNGKHM